MKISVKAKHLIREAIEEEKKLTLVETKEKQRGRIVLNSDDFIW